MRLSRIAMVLALGLVPAGAAAQRAKIQLAGTWKAETPDGPRSVVIRADSSASYGDETVRWRVVGDSIYIAFGDEWMVYGYTMRGTRLTLSGGDLDEPILLRRAGPATPRPDSIAVPPAPPATRRGNGAAADSRNAAPAPPGV